MIEKLFHLKENNTNARTEVIAGLTTFMTMAYILAVNPTMLSAAGMDSTAVLIATCLASFVGTMAMALLANYPFALAPGMGLNAYFASRGPVIDQKALAWALETGEIRYAGLDTMEQEPISPDDPLLKMDNVILNPHSGSYGTGSKKTQINMVCDLLPTAFTKGELPARCVANKAVLKENLGIKLI